MPEPVVVELEVIDVDHRHRDRRPAAERGLPRHLQLDVEAAPVGDAGQRVGATEDLELGVGQAQLLGPFGDLLLQRGVEGRVLHRDHELAGDDAYGVEPVLGERAAPEAVLEHQHRPGLPLGLHGQGQRGADVQPIEVRVLGGSIDQTLGKEPL
jgi:hypothetical protein